MVCRNDFCLYFLILASILIMEVGPYLLHYLGAKVTLAIIFSTSVLPGGYCIGKAFWKRPESAVVVSIVVLLMLPSFSTYTAIMDNGTFGYWTAHVVFVSFLTVEICLGAASRCGRRVESPESKP